MPALEKRWKVAQWGVCCQRRAALAVRKTRADTKTNRLTEELMPECWITRCTVVYNEAENELNIGRFAQVKACLFKMSHLEMMFFFYCQNEHKPQHESPLRSFPLPRSILSHTDTESRHLFLRQTRIISIFCYLSQCWSWLEYLRDKHFVGSNVLLFLFLFFIFLSVCVWVRLVASVFQIWSAVCWCVLGFFLCHYLNCIFSVIPSKSSSEK